MVVETRAALRVHGRHWETPSAAAGGLAAAGWVETPYDLDPDETGFVALHLWNAGDEAGG